MAEDLTKPKQINILDAQLPDGAASVLDPTDNPWEFSAPPPKGDYQMKFVLGSNGYQMALADPQDPNSVFYTADIEGRIVSDTDTNDFPAFMRVTTKIGRGKNLSTAAGMVVKFAGKLPNNEATPKQIMIWLDKCLKQEPVRWVHLDWRGSYETQGPNGESKWKNYASTMEGFPKQADGSYKHIVQAKLPNGGVEEVRAQLNIVHVYGKGETPTQRAKAPSVAAAAAPAAAPTVVLNAPSAGADDLSDLDLD